MPPGILEVSSEPLGGMHLRQLRILLPFRSQQVALRLAFLFLVEPTFLKRECYFHKFVFLDHPPLLTPLLTCPSGQGTHLDTAASASPPPQRQREQRTLLLSFLQDSGLECLLQLQLMLLWLHLKVSLWNQSFAVTHTLRHACSSMRNIT